MPCIYCGRGFHTECDTNCNNCHPVNEIEESLVRIGGKGAPTKEPEDVKDRLSTGRKRAAQQYPIFKNEACQWQGLKNCGGGLKPIVGCLDGKQKHRHHGPIKDPLHNDPRNVHKICNKCHVRWHHKNDPVYSEEVYATLPHNPEAASDKELIANEAYYRARGNR